MKRAIALVVLVAFLMQLTGCAVYRIQRVSYSPDQVVENIQGVSTLAGTEITFDKERPGIKRGIFWFKSPGPVIWVQNDTLYAFVDGESFQIATDEIMNISVRKTDVALSALVTVAAVAACWISAAGLMYLMLRKSNMSFGFG